MLRWPRRERRARAPDPDTGPGVPAPTIQSADQAFATLPALARAVEIVAGTLSSLPWRCTSPTGEPVPEHPMLDALRDPDGWAGGRYWGSGQAFVAGMVRQAMIADEAAALVIREAGRPLGLRPLTLLRSATRPNAGFALRDGDTGLPVRREDVFLLARAVGSRGAPLAGPRMATIAAAEEYRRVQQASIRAADYGGLGLVVVKRAYTDAGYNAEDAEEQQLADRALNRELQQRMTTRGLAPAIVRISGDESIDVLGSAREQGVATSRRLALEAVAAATGCAPELITGSSPAGAEDSIYRSFLRLTIRPWIAALSGGLQAAAAPFTLELDATTLRQTDAGELAEGLRVLREAAIISPNEARETAGYRRVDSEMADSIVAPFARFQPRAGGQDPPSTERGGGDE